MADQKMIKDQHTLIERFVDLGYLSISGEGHILTELGKEAGGELKVSKRFGEYFTWPPNLKITG